MPWASLTIPLPCSPHESPTKSFALYLPVSPSFSPYLFPSPLPTQAQSRAVIYRLVLSPPSVFLPINLSKAQIAVLLLTTLAVPVSYSLILIPYWLVRTSALSIRESYVQFTVPSSFPDTPLVTVSFRQLEWSMFSKCASIFLTWAFLFQNLFFSSRPSSNAPMSIQPSSISTIRVIASSFAHLLLSSTCHLTDLYSCPRFTVHIQRRC